MTPLFSCLYLFPQFLELSQAHIPVRRQEIMPNLYSAVGINGIFIVFISGARLSSSGLNVIR